MTKGLIWGSKYSGRDLNGRRTPGGRGFWRLRNQPFVLKNRVLQSQLFEISLSTNFTKNKSFSFGHRVAGRSYHTQSHIVSFNKVLTCLSVKFLVAKYDWNVLFMPTGLRRCCKTAQKPGRCKQGITAWQLRSEGKGSIPTLVVLFLFFFSFKKPAKFSF